MELAFSLFYAPFVFFFLGFVCFLDSFFFCREVSCISAGRLHERRCKPHLAVSQMCRKRLRVGMRIILCNIVIIDWPIIGSCHVGRSCGRSWSHQRVRPMLRVYNSYRSVQRYHMQSVSDHLVCTTPGRSDGETSISSPTDIRRH